MSSHLALLSDFANNVTEVWNQAQELYTREKNVRSVYAL